MNLRAIAFSLGALAFGVYGVNIYVASPNAEAQPARTAQLTRLEEEGLNLFFNARFGGNGRTCGTCHRANDNFGLSPNFIATLPANDSLFVAERNPALARGFESPEQMRANGLIRENLDGMEDLDNKFVLRGVPHIQALRTSVDSNFGAHTGWSGDGAPGSEERENNRAFMRIDGLGAPSLRSFATGAVIQHFTRTLNRRPGVDFILPTERQLIALEAYMLTVGRQGELSLPLRLRGAVASRGQALFMDSAPGGAQCSTCHFNAGANVNPAIFGPLGLSGNQNFDTGIESLLDTPARLLARPTPPVDDGQGRGPGDGTFNTPGLVEAADTGPFFHNNSVTTLESAVEFYDSDEFNDSPAGRLIIAATGSRVELDTMAVQNIAGFLRVINALESIRQADALLVEARRTVRRRGINLTLARDEMQDAIDVLNGASLHPDAAAILQEAKVLATTFGSTRNNFRNLDRARALLRNARGLMAAP